MRSIHVTKIGFKETRNLCKYHYDLFNNKEKKYALNFEKAAKFNKKTDYL